MLGQDLDEQRRPGGDGGVDTSVCANRARGRGAGARCHLEHDAGAETSAPVKRGRLQPPANHVPVIHDVVAWLVRRHHVRPNLAAAVAELAGLGEARHG